MTEQPIRVDYEDLTHEEWTAFLSDLSMRVHTAAVRSGHWSGDAAVYRRRLVCLLDVIEEAWARGCAEIAFAQEWAEEREQDRTGRSAS